MKLVLFEHCKIVQGAKHTILQDNLRGVLHRIPIEIAQYFDPVQRTTLSTFQKQEIEAYLIEQEFAFYTNHPDQFIASDNQLFQAFELEYCILEYSDQNQPLLPALFEDLKVLGCQHLELRCYEVLDLETIKSIVQLAVAAQFRSIDVYYKYNKQESFESYNTLTEAYPIINYFVVHSTEQSTIETLKEQGYRTYNNTVITAECIENNNCCGKISQNFVSSFSFYRTALQHNSCLYRKISVNKEGYVSNCPSMSHHFGHLSNTSILDVVQNSTFTKYWGIHKDQITKCKSCEYRYACSDCRAYREDPTDLYSAPLKCGYDPTTGIWEDWSANPLKQQSLQYYQLTP